jgi:hypothetical protein
MDIRIGEIIMITAVLFAYHILWGVACGSGIY